LESPEKTKNHRCPKRIISLINSIRKDDDAKVQEPNSNSIIGHLKLFIVDSTVSDKSTIEANVRHHMASYSDDKDWIFEDKIKTLTLEHGMAANRGGFSDFYLPLSSVDSLKDAALNGTSREIKFITKELLPLLSAINNDDEFQIVQIINRHSNLLSSNNNSFIIDPLSVLTSADEAISIVKKNMKEKPNISLKEILLLIQEHKLLIIPDKLSPHLVDTSNVTEESEEDSQLANKEFQALGDALDSNIQHVNNYSKYVSEKMGFGTHQGVKGLEFKRVMAILDDEEANGFLFSYEKLFGAKELSAQDLNNESKGIDSAISRTRRLFYVICSRAEKSLAVVAYTTEPSTVKTKAIASNWFTKDEVILL
jgi:DNA helicase-2/ATP-dependent DNA helicase PcrA